MSAVPNWSSSPIAKIAIGVLIITVIVLLVNQCKTAPVEAPPPVPSKVPKSGGTMYNDVPVQSPSACGMLSNGTYVPIENGCYARMNPHDLRPITYTGGVISETGDRGRVVDDHSVVFDNGNVGTIVGGSVVDQNGETSAIAYEAVAGADYLIVSTDENPCVRTKGIQLTPQNGIVPSTDSSKCTREINTVPENETRQLPLVPSLSATLCADNSNVHPWCERNKRSS